MFNQRWARIQKHFGLKTPTLERVTIEWLFIGEEEESITWFLQRIDSSEEKSHKLEAEEWEEKAWEFKQELIGKENEIICNRNLEVSYVEPYKELSVISLKGKHDSLMRTCPEINIFPVESRYL